MDVIDGETALPEIRTEVQYDYPANVCVMPSPAAFCWSSTFVVNAIEDIHCPVGPASIFDYVEAEIPVVRMVHSHCAQTTDLIFKTPVVITDDKTIGNHWRDSLDASDNVKRISRVYALLQQSQKRHRWYNLIRAR